MVEQQLLQKPLTAMIEAQPENLTCACYEQWGGYSGLRQIVHKSMSASDIQKVVVDSKLRGRGGAGFPTGVKWSFVPLGTKTDRQKYFVVNADEMEPGTFKDRYLIEHNPHQLIEGVIIASMAIEAHHAFIFIRSAYVKAITALKTAIAEAASSGYVGKNILGSGFDCTIHVHVSIGRYMCGEETGLLNALEGKRSQPRCKPPFPQVIGYFGNPTGINNVETVCSLSHILRNGPEWFKSLGKTNDSGTKLYGISGRVKKPGLWELPMGSTAREIFDRAGGMLDGCELRAFQPGGISTGFLDSNSLDIAMDFDSVQRAGSRLGTGCIIALDTKTCPVGVIHSIEKFFSRESCGFCTPCRESLPWAEKILWSFENGSAHAEDQSLLEHICFMISSGHTFCALAPGAADPLQSGMRLFRDDFERHVIQKKCPYKGG